MNSFAAFSRPFNVIGVPEAIEMTLSLYRPIGPQISRHCKRHGSPQGHAVLAVLNGFANSGEAARALDRLALHPAPLQMAAVLNFPAVRATPRMILQEAQKLITCDASFAFVECERTRALTHMWPKSLVSSASEHLGIDPAKSSEMRVRSILEDARAHLSEYIDLKG